MARLCTMGTASCGTMALGYFKNDNPEDNDLYLKDPKGGRKKFSYGSEGDISWFMNEVIMPTRQDLGRTGSVPFDMLMDDIETHEWAGKKFIIATLAAHQMMKGSYWRGRLEARGFELVDCTMNNISDQLNYIFVRNPVRPSNITVIYQES